MLELKNIGITLEMENLKRRKFGNTWKNGLVIQWNKTKILERESKLSVRLFSKF